MAQKSLRARGGTVSTRLEMTIRSPGWATASSVWSASVSNGVLREAMRARIPESVRTRVDKMGFPVPASKWLDGVLREPVLDLMLSWEVRERGIYHVDSIIRD